MQQALRVRFRQITVPEGLREQIISERRVWTMRQRWQRPLVHPKDEVTFDTYCNRMISAVLRQYAMSLETNDPVQIRAHLARQAAPADYVLPPALEKVTTTGCGVLGWQQKPVSMICFHSGRPLRLGEKTDMFLFVINRDTVPDAPSGPAPRIADVNSLVTATWTRGGKVYVLALEGDAALIRQYLN